MDVAKPTDLNDQNDRESELPSEEEAPAEAQEAPDELETVRREVEELREKNLRLLAEQRNQQQRAERERAQALKYAEGDFARELLVVLDDLERTRESVEEAADVQAVADGVRIIYEHFLKVLKGHHIEPIEALGQPFDPDLHAAMLQQPSDEHPAGTVMEELTRGYKMHDRVLRHSRVVVSSGPAEAADADASESKRKDGEDE